MSGSFENHDRIGLPPRLYQGFVLARPFTTTGKNGSELIAPSLSEQGPRNPRPNAGRRPDLLLTPEHTTFRVHDDVKRRVCVCAVTRTGACLRKTYLKRRGFVQKKHAKWIVFAHNVPQRARFGVRRVRAARLSSTYAKGQHVLRGVRGAVLALVFRQLNLIAKKNSV